MSSHRLLFTIFLRITGDRHIEFLRALALALGVHSGLIGLPNMPFRKGYQWPRVRDSLLVSLWLLGLAIVNQKSRLPIYSIFPYAFPVILVSWRYGILPAFVVSAFATLAAFPGDYLAEHSKDEMFWAASTTYIKLSVIVALTLWVKRWTARHADD